MKGLYRLINIEFAAWLRFIALLCIGVVFSPLLLLRSAMNNYSEFGGNERFEDVYMASGCAFVFLVYYAAACGFFLKSFYAGYWGSKSIYTYLTLPVKREALYLSRLIVFMTCLFLLITAQLLSIRLGYGFFLNQVEKYAEGEFVMNNGLFLAHTRSEFLRILLPLSPSRVISSISLFLAIVTGIYYAVLCERARRYWGFILIGILILLVINVLGYRMNESIYYHNPKSLYISSISLLTLSVLFIGYSIRLIKKGAIA